MKYAVETASRRVEQQIKRLPKEIYPRVKQAVISLEDVPRPPGAVKLKDDIYRIRIGDYRVIYFVDDSRRLAVVVKVARRSGTTYRGV